MRALKVLLAGLVVVALGISITHTYLWYGWNELRDERAAVARTMLDTIIPSCVDNPIARAPIIGYHFTSVEEIPRAQGNGSARVDTPEMTGLGDALQREPLAGLAERRYRAIARAHTLFAIPIGELEIEGSPPYFDTCAVRIFGR